MRSRPWGRAGRSLFRGAMFLGLLLLAVGDGWWRRRVGVLRPGREGAVWIHGWCRRMVRALGIAYEVTGEFPMSGAVVCNHLSYLDILLMSAVRPFVMVAKTEVRGWPLLGWLTAQAGTVYVERGGGPARHAVVNARMAEAYATGLPVLFFPEGTTTDGGMGVLPFRRGLFHSVLQQQASLRVAALRYAVGEGNGIATVGGAVCWWGEMTFVPHLVRFLGLRNVSARVHFGDLVTERADRFAMSETAREQVAAMYDGLLGEESAVAAGAGAEGIAQWIRVAAEPGR